jgi:hypothetical protein
MIANITLLATISQLKLVLKFQRKYASSAQNAARIRDNARKLRKIQFESILNAKIEYTELEIKTKVEVHTNK